jgi:DNA-binding response OmpR family regulator
MLTVLIVDDESENCEVLQRLFHRSGWGAATVSDAGQVLDEIKAVHADVVLLDVMMPDIDGFSILRQIRADAEVGTTPVVMYSALGDDATRTRALAAGADDYIVKTTPFADIKKRIAGLAA